MTQRRFGTDIQLFAGVQGPDPEHADGAHASPIGLATSSWGSPQRCARG